MSSYLLLWRDSVLVSATKASAILGVLTGLLTPPLALLGAMGVRELGARRTVLAGLLLPLFVPGVTMGLAMAFFFRLLGIPPSLFTVLIVHVMWALPFAVLIILTAMARFDPVYVEAAYVLGAGRVRAFLDVEFPLIRNGITGAGAFSLILSLNETVRTGLVQGPINTIPTYIWSTYLQVGISQSLYALMSLMILLTLVAVLILPLVAPQRRRLLEAP
jgi:spermidine/putrescine transport system permease protein